MDVQTLSIGVGLIVSLMLTELFGLATGGMIVPGYIALSLDKPLDVVATLGVALATYGMVALVSKVAFVYGRRRIVLMVLVSFVIGSLVRATAAYAAAGLAATATTGSPQATLQVIGYIIPGLIALWVDRQGLVETLAPLVTSAVVVRLVLVLLGMEILT